MFLEPVVRAPRVLVEGDMPIAEALRRLGAQIGLDMVAVIAAGTSSRGPRDLALVVAGHGREELPRAAPGLEAGLPVRRPRGEPPPRPGRDRRAARRRRRRRAAGADRHARPDSTSARARRRRSPSRSSRGSSRCAARVAARRAVTAVDPICGMTVAVTGGTPSLEHEGETVYFCAEGCRRAFAAQHACLSPSSAGSSSAPAARSGSGARSSCSRTATARCSATSWASRARAGSTRRSSRSAAPPTTCARAST